LSVSAMGAGASPPDFTPNPSAGWFAYSRQFIPPKSGAGPVRQDPAHPLVSNDDYRVSGREIAMGAGSGMASPAIARECNDSWPARRMGIPV
jgi:hypothetical protein